MLPKVFNAFKILQFVSSSFNIFHKKTTIFISSLSYSGNRIKFFLLKTVAAWF